MTWVVNVYYLMTSCARVTPPGFYYSSKWLEQRSSHFELPVFFKNVQKRIAPSRTEGALTPRSP